MKIKLFYYQELLAMTLFVFLLAACSRFPAIVYVPDASQIPTGFIGVEPGNSLSKTGKKNFDSDLEIIRKRIVDDLLEPSVSGKEIRELMKSIQQEGSWPNINYKDVSRTGFQHSIHLQNMLQLARAYKKPGSEFYGNAELKEVVSSALNFWIDHDFICDNWWWNEMGTPNWMINTLLVLDSDLTAKQRTEGTRIAGRANLQASGARPGGDLIQIAGMLGKQALFARNEDTLERVIKVMASEIKITTGRGLKPDLSFHHRVDNVISTLAYGTGYANSFAYWAVKIAGTKFTFPQEAMRLLIDYYLDGICQSMVHGRYPDPGAKNRDITRRAALGPAGWELPENLRKASSYRANELEEIIKIRKGEKQTSLRRDRFFWHSEYFTHQRLDYYTSVRMHSARGNNMEQPHNEEGLKNHHYADGSNFISRTGKEYFDIFPVWDWQKIPGTTVVQKPDVPHWRELAKKGLSEFVGGVTDGEYGAAAFDFASVHDPLKARKSWFFFDREYVCLGTAITSEAVYPVVTTLNQCLLNKEVLIKARNRKLVAGKGNQNVEGASWIYHDSIAYLFPSATSVVVSNLTAQGNWRQINHQAWATEEMVSKEVFTLSLDHGVKPHNAGYAYIVIPGIGASSVDGYAKKSEVQILNNSSEIQAVKHNGLNRTQIVFYKPGTIKISNDITLTAESPCLVMVETKGQVVKKIAVSDPSRKLNSLQLTMTAPFEASGKNWKSIWNKEKKLSIIEVELLVEGYAGRSVILGEKEKNF